MLNKIRTILMVVIIVLITTDIVLRLYAIKDDTSTQQVVNREYNTYNITYNITQVQPKEEVVKKESPKVAKEQPKKEEIKKEVKPKAEPKISKESVKMNTNELDLLARIINAEARNQPYEGKIAVGNVIMNRVNNSKFPNTIKEVIYQKGQFYPVVNGAINKQPSEDSIKAAKEVLAGRTVVNSNVLYFYNPVTSTSDWIFSREVSKKIGDHAFAF